MRDKLIVEAPAKVNLTLDVKGKRTDGYHELETVMHQISLRDRIYLERLDQGIRLITNSALLSDGEENLAYRAAQLLFTEYGIKAGIGIFIEKNIPVGAGLAGGSTDAAAVLRGVNQLLGLPATEPALLDLAAKLGSDVPFCLQGGTALARGRGEILTGVEHRRLEMVLVKPDFQLSTAEVYRSLRMDRIEFRPDHAAFFDAWNNYDIIGIAKNSRNVLETVSIGQYPQISVIKQELIRLGALNAVMSGSGPTVCGIFLTREEGCKAWQQMKQQYKESYLVSSYNI
jgi:4-diphosphocytidyl-2-C-methyl-D-erythritol kinase